jgi:hypothetical protein
MQASPLLNLQWVTLTDGGPAMEFAKPDHGFTPHGGEFEGRSLEQMVMEPEGRAALAAHIPHQGKGRQKLALAWLSWGLQQEVTLENLDRLTR